MLPLSDWLDRDDVTDEDLVMLTAEREVYDWLHDTPIPQPSRPDWLPPEAEWAPRLSPRISRPPRQATSFPWGWVAGTLAMGSLLLLSAMASAVGVAFITLV